MPRWLIVALRDAVSAQEQRRAEHELVFAVQFAVLVEQARSGTLRFQIVTGVCGGARGDGRRRGIAGCCDGFGDDGFCSRDTDVGSDAVEECPRKIRPQTAEEMGGEMPERDDIGGAIAEQLLTENDIAIHFPRAPHPVRVLAGHEYDVGRTKQAD